MKYLKFTGILLFTVFRKVFGLFWFWVAALFRDYARNVVYNYTLQNDIWLKRLYERSPKRESWGWSLHSDRTVPKGLVMERKVFWLEYQLVYWCLWGWLDDDSNRDFTDVGYLESILNGERLVWFKDVFCKRLVKEHYYLRKSTFGNTFELGDGRKHHKIYLRKAPLSAFLWLVRNTAYNFKYSQWETVEEKDAFLFKVKNKCIGWVPEGVVDGKQNYSLRFFESE